MGNCSKWRGLDVTYGKPEIAISYRDSQFTAQESTAVALGAGCKLRVDGGGAWRGNVFTERSIKYGRVYLKVYDSLCAARADTAEYLSWYNPHRSLFSLERPAPDASLVAVDTLGNFASVVTRPHSTHRSRNAVPKNVTTSAIELFKANDRGLCNFTNYCAKILFHCGTLDLALGEGKSTVNSSKFQTLDPDAA